MLFSRFWISVMSLEYSEWERVMEFEASGGGLGGKGLVFGKGDQLVLDRRGV